MSWSVVSTMLGIAETVLPCVAHYLNSDAEQIHIYLDAPLPKIEAALARHPRCVVTVCDESYWSKKPGGRPGKIARQRANVADARHHSRSDWLLHIDSDEFVVPLDFSGPLRLTSALKNVPESHDWVCIQPLERVLPAAASPESIFEGIFRARCDDHPLIAAAYGDGASFLHRGLSGHFQGKVAFRRTTKLRVRLHDLIDPARFAEISPRGVTEKDLPPHTRSNDYRLLHFEGWTPLHWVSKLIHFVEDGRAKGHHHRGREACKKFIIEHPSADERLALFDRVQRITTNGLSLLKSAGLIHSASFDPRALARNIFPNIDFNFEVSTVDNHLRGSNQDFYVRNNM